MKLEWKYFWLMVISLGAVLILPGLLFPICEGCCVCSFSAHVNDRAWIVIFFYGLSVFFWFMAFIEEWANGS
jgi:uncharacterized membrane protein